MGDKNTESLQLKPLAERRPKEKLSHSQMLKEISKKTGFRVCDIREVLKCYGEVGRQTLLDGKQLYIPLIGTAYPIVKVGRYSPVLQMKKGGDGITKPMIVPKFCFNKVTKRQLKEIEVSKEVEQAQYK